MSRGSDETMDSSCEIHDPAEVRASVTIQVIPPQEVPEEIQEALKKPTFRVWSVQDKEMLTLLEHMFYDLNLVAQFKMEAATLRKFLRCLQDHYRQNPFHNFRHGFCVTQMMYSVIFLCGLQDLLPPEDTVTLMVASLCHDVDHPGLNNNYQVNARTELASRYQNTSPLENHHCAVTMEILSRGECDIFRHAAPEEARKILEGVAELILATDMAHHPQILSSLQDVHSFSFSNKEHVALSDREKAEGLPITPYMDRDTVTKAKSQRSFISFLLIPLCEALCQIFPQMTVWMLQPLQEASLRYDRQMMAGRDK